MALAAGLLLLLHIVVILLLGRAAGPWRVLGHSLAGAQRRLLAVARRVDGPAHRRPLAGRGLLRGAVHRGRALHILGRLGRAGILHARRAAPHSAAAGANLRGVVRRPGLNVLGGGGVLLRMIALAAAMAAIGRLAVGILIGVLLFTVVGAVALAHGIISIHIQRVYSFAASGSVLYRSIIPQITHIHKSETPFNVKLRQFPPRAGRNGASLSGKG